MSEKYYIEFNRNTYYKVKDIISCLPPFCQDFFIAIETRTSELTRLNYASDLITFFDYLISHLPSLLDREKTSITYQDMEALTAGDIERFISHVSYYSNKGKVMKNSERGKARKLSAIRSLFRYLYINDKITKDVASKVLTPKIHDKPIIRLENTEVRKLLDIVESESEFRSDKRNAYNLNTKERDLAILTLFLGTGIRVSELVGLDLSDIDFDSLSFYVTRKGGNRSILYFTQEVKDAILSYLPIREKMLKSANIENMEALFLSLQKKRITVRAVEYLVKKHAHEASPLKKISPHKLRSTYGTKLYSNTRDIYAVAEILGHRDVNTTKKHYAAISENIKKEAAQKVKLREDATDD
ncbi:MAG: tyrosine-type recombinase/integrase [Christensenellaceae bacterium]|jgi:site-specific recombinase XerD|nr:tyrosine-type recombinase/integrase [Christensenellaceae bacterium]